MRHNSVVIDTTHGLFHFPHLTMQVKSALSQTSAKPQAVFVHDNITIPQMTTNTITALVDHLSEWNTTRTVTPVEKFTGTAPEMSRNVFSISQGTNEDDSQRNHHPEAGLFNNQMTQTLAQKTATTWRQEFRERERERESLRPRHGDRSSRRSHLLLL